MEVYLHSITTFNFKRNVDTHYRTHDILSQNSAEKLVDPVQALIPFKIRSLTSRPVLNWTWAQQKPVFSGKVLQCWGARLQTTVWNGTSFQQKKMLFPCRSVIGRFQCIIQTPASTYFNFFYPSSYPGKMCGIPVSRPVTSPSSFLSVYGNVKYYWTVCLT